MALPRGTCLFPYQGYHFGLGTLYLARLWHRSYGNLVCYVGGLGISFRPVPMALPQRKVVDKVSKLTKNAETKKRDVLSGEIINNLT